LTALPIIRTDRADEDLIDIWASIAADNPTAAERLLDAIEARWRQLTHHPYSGRARNDIAPNIRPLAVGQYLTLYRVSDECIEVVRVLHGGRKIDRDTVT